MKRIRTALALALVLLLIPAGLPAGALSHADFTYFPNTVEAAIYVMEQYEAGVELIHVRLPQGTNMNDAAWDIFVYVRMQLAEYYTLNHATLLSGGPYFELTVSLDGREGQRRQAEEKAAQVVAQVIREDMTTRDKLLVLHDYVVENCVYSTNAARSLNSNTVSAYTAYGMLLKGSAVCDGYSAAYALLCRYAGIPCIQVFSPDMDGAGHSWNAVLLEGEILYVDTTFDDPDWMDRDDAYFLVDGEQLRALGHTWDENVVQALTAVLWDETFRAANSLSILGLFTGSDTGYELARPPYRSEASVMLLRLMGLEAEAEAAGLPCPFEDVSPFYAPYIAYLYEAGLTQGTGPGTFSPGEYVNLQQYMTFVLRALGYDDSTGDFEWKAAVDAAVSFGVLDREEADLLLRGTFDRGAMALVSYRALFAQLREGGRLIDRLVDQGHVDARALAEVAAAVR